MKPNYKNWMPKGMIIAFITVSGLLLTGIIVVGFATPIASNTPKIILLIILGVTLIAFSALSVWSIKAYLAFSYDGTRQLSKQIIEGIAEYISVPKGGKILDVGCGSGALAIACAKKNPFATAVGIDRWGKEYASFSKQLCENNAKAENTKNTLFQCGNALELAFPSESFDAVTSNYVYHNIPGKNKQDLLLETLRVLKKGGMFALHDLMTPHRYGDMNAFVSKLKQQNYQKVELIDTTQDVFMNPKEAKTLHLEGSTLLYGIK